MQIAKLEADTRQAQGTRAARRLRREDKVPGVIYGHKKDPKNVAVPIKGLKDLLEHGAHVVELNVAGAIHQVLIKDVQFDHMGTEPVHVDFTNVDLSERVTVSVPLEFRGTPVGTHEGGTLDHSRVDLEIECLVTEIPSSIRVNVVDLNVGDKINAGQVELPPNIKVITPAEAIVCSVRAKIVAEEITEEGAAEEGPAEPEIIGEKEKEAREQESKK